jgi:hypothetical protein
MKKSKLLLALCVVMVLLNLFVFKLGAVDPNARETICTDNGCMGGTFMCKEINGAYCHYGKEG